MFFGLIDLGTHMSIARLPSGKYLVIDTIPLDDALKTKIDQITNGGKDIEAVLATHPFHTLSFPAFRAAYPSVEFYGTPRHLKKQPELNWKGDLNDCNIRNKWSPHIEMRIPAGAEFVVPVPEKTNHFSSVFVFHRDSKTIHVDDTIMYFSSPSLLMRLAGFKANSMRFHLTLSNVGLHPTPEAPFQFRDWIKGLLNDWDFDNICTAHTGNKIGGAKQQLKDVLEQSESTFQSISKKNQKEKKRDQPSHKSYNVSDNECG